VNIEDFSENELRTLEGLVNDERQWAVITKMVKRQIALFWEALRQTDVADEARVSANHKMAKGVDSALGNFVLEIETIANFRKTRAAEPKIMEDITKELYQ
jgi:hypothetical protein